MPMEWECLGGITWRPSHEQPHSRRSKAKALVDAALLVIGSHAQSGNEKQCSREGEECGGGQGLTPMLRPGNPDHCGSLEVTGSGNGRLTADGRLRYASTSSSRSTRCSSHCPAAGRPFILTNIVVCRGV